MGCLGIAIAFAMRMCLSIAMTEMVMPVNHTESNNQSIMCSFDDSTMNQSQPVSIVSRRFKI